MKKFPHILLSSFFFLSFVGIAEAQFPVANHYPAKHIASSKPKTPKKPACVINMMCIKGTHAVCSKGKPKCVKG